MRAPDLVIFDCDGVLVDSEVIACRTDAECLGEIGITITADEIMDRYTGTSAAAMIADLGARYGKTVPADFADILHRRLWAAFETGLSAVAGIEDMLDALACRVCVASSSTPERLRHSLSLTGLLRYFEPHVFSTTQVARGKPAPDLFVFAARAMHVTPQACVVIEDSIPGVEAAVAAGIPVYGFVGGGHCRPGHADRLRRAGASAIFERMDMLPGLLAGSSSAAGRSG